jgi:hypothetical protein
MLRIGCWLMEDGRAVLFLTGSSSGRLIEVVGARYTSILQWRRDVGASLFLDLPPAGGEAQRDEDAAIACDYDRIVNQPVALRLNKIPRKLDGQPRRRFALRFGRRSSSPEPTAGPSCR